MPRRILFFLAGFATGGAERQTIELARRLRLRGHACRFLAFRTIHSPVADADVLAHTTFIDGGHPMLDPRSFGAVWRAIASENPEVLVCVNQTPTVLGAWGKLSRRYAARVVGTLHSTKLVSLRAKAQLSLLRWSLPALDCLVFISEKQRRYWEDRRLAAHRTEVIHNGIDIARFAPFDAAGRAESRRRLGLQPEDYVAGLLATFRPEKNHKQLIDAVVALRARGLPAKALLVGGGPMRASVEAYAAVRGVAGHVLFAGEQNDVRPFIAAMDVGVICSVAVETLSLAALETMAMGVPMVMSDIGGASEIVEEGVNGLLFGSGDTEGLVARLLALADPVKRRSFALEAEATVRARFTNTLMADRYEALFDSLSAPSADDGAIG